MLIISDGTDIEKLVKAIREDDDNGILICGICIVNRKIDDKTSEDREKTNFVDGKVSGISTKQNIEGIEVVCDRNSVTEYICREWVDEVMVKVADSFEFVNEETRRNRENSGSCIESLACWFKVDIIWISGSW